MAIVKDLGMVTAYAYAVAGGYEGTEAEFTELLGQAGVTLEQLENLSAVAVTLSPGSEATASYSDGVLTFGIPQGDKGDKGDTGNGIASIAKTGSSGLVDTYTITYTNGNSMTFTVTNGAQGNPGPTGNGISSIAKTGTSGLIDTYTITFTDGNTTTFTVTNGEDGTVTPEQMTEAIADALDTFSVESHEDMTAGLAEQLLSDIVTTDKKPYLFRRTGADATREFDCLVGGSVVANQLVDSGTTSVTLTSGHKYYTVISGTATIQAGSGSAVSVTGGTDTVTDLTKMFGSTIADYAYTLEQANAGSGIAWLKSYGFFAGYQAYNAGAMVHVSGVEAHVMTGFNQWDEEAESGDYNVSSGSGIKRTDATRMRSKNFIPVIPGETYYCKSSYQNTFGLFYDENKSFGSGSDRCSAINGSFTVPTWAHYMTFYYTGTTYNHDICINLSNPAKNGQYEPYTVNSYTLDDTLTLRGIPKLSNGEIYYDGDTYASDGAVSRRYALVDLGTLYWVDSSMSSAAATLGRAVESSMDDLTKRCVPSEIGNMACIKYVRNSAAILFGGISGIAATDRGRIKIYDTAFLGKTNGEVKSMLSSVMLVYELATPTTETSTPYQSPQICDPDGTEQYITDGIPVGHTTEYPANLKGEIERVMVQVPKPPTSNGTYSLKCTVAASGTTYAWTT